MSEIEQKPWTQCPHCKLQHTQKPDGLCPRCRKDANDVAPKSPEEYAMGKGALGGLAMMAIAAIWFGVGYAAGYIYFYPPILFLIGAAALAKGISEGNLSGGE